jgi:hypothetical protein
VQQQPDIIQEEPSLSALQRTSARTCKPIKRHNRDDDGVVVFAFAKAKRHQTMKLMMLPMRHRQPGLGGREQNRISANFRKPENR